MMGDAFDKVGRSDAKNSPSDLPFQQLPEKEADNLRHPLEIFPVEIWQMISEHLDPNDFERLLNTSPSMRHIVKRKTTELLFGKVFTVLGKVLGEQVNSEKRELELQENLNYDGPSACEDQYISYSETTPLCSDLMNLRLVCKSWRRGIDHYYEDLSSNWFTKEKCTETTFFFPNHWKSYNFGDLRSEVNLKPIQFLEHFKKTHKRLPGRNPFIGRCVRFIDDFCASDTNKSMTDILVKYGHQIRFCNAIQPYGQVGAVNYLKMKQMLECMPFLEVLKLWNYSNGEPLTREAFSTLTETIEKCPLPKFDNLKCLSVQNWWSPIFNKIIRESGSQLTKLEIRKGKEHEDYDIYSVPLPNLTHLTIRSCYSPADFLKLASVKVQCPLSVLHFTFHEDVIMNWTEVFAVLETKWGNTLRELDITLPQQPSATAIPVQLKLDCIQTLKITMDSYYPLDFLLSMRESLEFLEIVIENCKVAASLRDEMVRQVEEAQQLNFFLDNPLDSNVWTLFPKIKHIRLYSGARRWSHTRLDWLERQNKRCR